MATPPTIIAVLWIAFWVYWVISAARTKRTIRTRAMWACTLMHTAIIVLVIILFKVPAIRQFLTYGASPNRTEDALGLLLCIAGLAFAVWARIHLGRNWGVPMSTKENPELVTRGPYRFARHPIYSGILLGMLGSALVERRVWALVFLLFAVYCIYSAKGEEKLMTQQFPNQYPEYKKRTKMLIPYVF